MPVEDLCTENTALYRLRVSSEADPGVLPRLLGHFQNLNIIPRRVVADLDATSVLHVELELCGLPEGRVSAICAKIAQSVSVLDVSWHRV